MQGATGSVAGSEKYPFLSCCSLPSPYGHLRCSCQQAVLTPFRTELVVWGTGTWKPTCQFNSAGNTLPSPGSQGCSLPCSNGHKCSDSVLPRKNVSPISLFPWWEIGGMSKARRQRARYGSGVPARTAVEEPWDSIGIEPCCDSTISSISASGGQIWDPGANPGLLPGLLLCLPNSSSSSSTVFAWPDFYGCSRVFPNSPPERTNHSWCTLHTKLEKSHQVLFLYPTA